MIVRVHWLIAMDLILVIGIFLGCSGSDEKTLATFRGGSVSEGEFKTRYQTYLDQMGQRDNIVLRKQILNNMINERLMIRDLEEKGFEARPETRERLEQIRLQAILDRYSRLISVDTMQVTEQELRDEFRAYNSKASARYLYAKSEEEAWELKTRLQRGDTFDKLARNVFEDPGLANNGGYLGSFGWGEMESQLEQVAFSLPIGEISDPFPVKAGYGILKVESRVTQPLASEFDYAKLKEKLRRPIVEKKTARLINETAHGIAKELAPVFDEKALTQVFTNWNYVTEGQIDVEQHIPESISSSHLVSFHGGSWKVSDFFERIHRTSSRQRSRVVERSDVMDVIAGLLVREELIKRAMDEDLEDDPQVTSQIDAVSYQFRLKSWREMAEKIVAQTEWDEKILRDHFERNWNLYVIQPEVNVAEILVRTREEAVRITRMVKEGADFGSLASKHSIRLWAGKQGGELGFGTRASFGILEEKFFASRVGEIIGPEFVDPYYGVFEILDRREGRPKTFDEARDEVIRSQSNVRTQEALKDALESLRARGDIKIDMDVLANIVIETHVKGRNL